MNTLQKVSKGFVLGLMLMVSISALPVAAVHAQDDSGYGGGCDLCSGSYLEGVDYSTADNNPSYLEGVDYSTDTENPSYLSGIDYSSPSFDVRNPSYASGGYSTSGGGYSSGGYSTSGGYSSGGYRVTGGTGFSSTPVYIPTPSYHTPIPGPIVYNTAPHHQQQQQQIIAQAPAQPILINNNNNNTNNNNNVNSAPVTQVVNTQPQQTVVYAPAPVHYIPKSGVSLSQIPYTGFDFGPVGNAIYWAALISFALAAAYLLVYYRGGAFTLATALVGGRSTRNEFKPVRFTDEDLDSATITETTVEAPAPAPVAINHRLASVVSNLPIAETRRATSDAMIVNHSTNGEAPRIVISRA